MMITTRYSPGETVFFIYDSSIFFSEVLCVEVSDRPDKMYVAYICKLVFPGQPEKESSIVVREENLFSNKDELIKVISDRFLEAIAKGDT